MSRRRSGELDFSSDSFLDIIANIVGILIILIVIAGLRAARTPPNSVAETAKPSKPVPVAQPSPAVVLDDTPSPPQPVVLPPIPLSSPTPDDSLLEDMRKLRARLAKSKAAKDSLLARLRTSLDAQRSAEFVHAQQLQRLQTAAGVSEGARDRITRLQTSTGRNRETLKHLRQRYDEAKRKADNTETIQHTMTPLGRTVTGEEVHFRIARGKVAHVPIEELVKRMQEEVVRRKSWLMKHPTHKGPVGPVKGFSMDYVVQRQLTSVMTELRTGYGQVRIMLAGWKINPTADLDAEDIEQALGRESKFLQEVRVAPDTATITFWVYPDSFGTFRKLQQAVRNEGLRVAARPLPFGIPIAGSPRGSRSSGQ